MTTTKNDPMKEAFKPIIEEVLFELAPELLKLFRDVIEAEEKHVLFTKAELAEKWGCTVGTVHKILKDGDVEPVGKRGNELEYPIELAQEAKDYHDSREIKNHQISVRARAMKI